MNIERIRNLREDNDLTQVELATVLNITQRAYSRYETGERALDDWVSPGWLGRAAAGDTVVKGSLKYYGMACLVLGLAVLMILFGESLNRISLSWYVKGEVEPSDTFYMIQVLGWVLLLGFFVILCVSGLNELG